MRYVISDLHLGHGNIIEYCDRPFSDVEEMDAEIEYRWNETVDPNDSVLVLGDFVYPESDVSPADWVEILNGNIAIIRGNHDGELTSNLGAHVMDSCVVTHGKYQFYCEHQPSNTGIWQLHGHIHNNDPDTYPFINRENKTVNVSAELLDYRPLRMDTLAHLLDNNQDYSKIE